MTDAEYYLAESAEDLIEVFAEVPSHLTKAKATIELTAAFTGLGGLLALVAIALAQFWQPIPYGAPASRETTDP